MSRASDKFCRNCEENIKLLVDDGTLFHYAPDVVCESYIRFLESLPIPNTINNGIIGILADARDKLKQLAAIEDN